MSSWATDADGVIAPVQDSDQGGRTPVRVQVIPLCICAVASLAFVAVTNLPWFGDIAGDNSTPQYSAVSEPLVRPGSPGGLTPGTESWGHLMVAWSTLVTTLAVVAVVACAVNRHRHLRSLGRLLICVGLASLVLVALVVPEFTATVPYDLVSTVGFSWGAIVGLGLAVLSSLVAWFAWATLRYPRHWGLEPSED